MIQLPNPLDIQTLHKTLPKKFSHIKEEAKVKFINQAVKTYRENLDFGKIDFVKSLYDGNDVNIVFEKAQIKIPIEQLVHDILEKWYFGNLEKNENVYFYRFVNVFRSLLTNEEWKIVDKFLSTSNNLVLKENYKQYAEYRRKLDEIDEILLKDNFTAKENY